MMGRPLMDLQDPEYVALKSLTNPPPVLKGLSVGFNAQGKPQHIRQSLIFGLALLFAPRHGLIVRRLWLRRHPALPAAIPTVHDS